MCNEYTGEETAVTVDPDKVLLFLDRSIFEELPEACPFFRTDQKTGKAYCTVHLTRPEICRDYGCWRLLISISGGGGPGGSCTSGILLLKMQS